MTKKPELIKAMKQRNIIHRSHKIEKQHLSATITGKNTLYIHNQR
jgi:hypothetical protein